MERQECTYCKKPISDNYCNITYVFEDKLKDLAFCSANCRENFIEFFQGVRDNINSQFNDGKNRCKFNEQIQKTHVNRKELKKQPFLKEER